ncbi:MAG: Gfo/Idh/MocA family oxidoreductase [Armatimonadetes bacterium]|nr:Gfo/Idh/MocA family oxidoreductase [Armatimonadota bacterium]
MSDRNMDRRSFLKGAAGAVALLISADELFQTGAVAAAEGAEAPVTGPPVKIGVIGLGQWGKQIITTLSKLPPAKITAVCDTYAPFVEKVTKQIPEAAALNDYKKALESPEVEAVVIATPTHQHKEIVLAAVQAGKHVYIESPLAVTVEEAKEIAQAGMGAKQVFQVGQQGRSNPLYVHVEQFVRSGALGNPAVVYAQSNKKNSWRKMAPSPEREQEQNWRLAKKTSPGLIGEVGIHQIDLANWYLNALPVAATGFGSISNWKDGREVFDTVQCMIEYPNNVRMIYTATLVSSFSGEYNLFQGSDSSLLLRDNRGWMVKEADSPLLGWEVYARKEQTFEETGICMIADATKIIKEGKEPGKEGSATTRDALLVALENFTRSIRENAKTACTALDGYRAAVSAIKANEAVNSASRIFFAPEWFDLGAK